MLRSGYLSAIFSVGDKSLWLSAKRLGGVLLLCLSGFALATTSISGAVTADTIWTAEGGPYVLDNVVIQNGAKLTVAAGSVLKMNFASSLTIQSGALLVKGTVQSPVYITSSRSAQSPGAGDWGKLIFQPNSAVSKIENAVIEYGSGIEINSSSPVINNVLIRKNRGAAIRLDVVASPEGSGNRAEDNDINAIVVPAGDIAGKVKWGVRGIPYYLASGALSVGLSPSINSVLPSSIQQGKTATVSLVGQRLSGLTGVQFDKSGLAATVLSGGSDTSASLQVTASAQLSPGPVRLIAMTHAGEIILPAAIMVLAQQPVLTSINPSSLVLGQGNATIGIVGESFSAQTQVLLDGNVVPSVFVSSTDLQVVIPNQSELATRSIRVRTPDAANAGQYFLSNELPLSIAAQALSFSESSLDLYKGGTTRYLTLRLAYPAPAGGVTINLASSNSAVATVQSSAFFAEGSTQQSVGVTGVAAGSANITASQMGYLSARATAAVTVPPTLGVEPLPLAVPPDSSSHGFNLRLSRADTVNHALTLTLADSSFATISPASMTLLAGQTVISGTIKGLKTGQTKLIISSPTLGQIEAPLFVTADYLAMSVSFSAPLGVVVPDDMAPLTQSVGPVAAGQLGVVVGSYMTGLTPDRLSIGANNVTVTAKGEGLTDVRSVTVIPDTGLTLGSPTIAADGRSVDVSVSVSADAPTQLRRVVLKDSQGIEIPVINSGADRLQITLPQPEIISIDPLYATPGQTISMKVRGKNLQSVTAVNLTPAGGVVIDNLGSLQVAADGSSLTVGMAFAADAAVGTRLLTVTAPGGTSTATAGPSNTFKVVNTIKQLVAPVATSQLGVFVGDPNVAESNTLSRDVVTRLVGVLVGSGITAVSPRVGIVGSTTTLTLTGSGLQTVDTLKLNPADGVTVSSVTPAADGNSVTVQLLIDATAPKVLRQLQVSAAGLLLPFASVEQATFLISAPQPQVDFIEPNYLLLGQAPQVLKVRGKNLTGATVLQVLPSTGMTISAPPTVSSDGTELTVNISAAVGSQTGKRAVVISTPAGDSDANPSAANTLILGEKIQSLVTPVTANLLGVQVGSTATTADPVIVDPVVSGFLGVQVGAVDVDPGFIATFKSADLGVHVGPVINAMTPVGILRGQTVNFVFAGHDLQNVDRVQAVPATGLSVGTVVAAADGLSVTVPVTVASDSTVTSFSLIPGDANGDVVLAGPALKWAVVGNALPSIASMSPIVFKQGESATLVIRGSNLAGVKSLLVSPAADIELLSQPEWGSDTFGEKLSVNIKVSANAATGNRVVQVITPWGSSAAAGSVANTLTITTP